MLLNAAILVVGGDLRFEPFPKLVHAVEFGPLLGQPFAVDFCTVARWDENGQIIEENLFYDMVGLTT